MELYRSESTHSCGENCCLQSDWLASIKHEDEFNDKNNEREITVQQDNGENVSNVDEKNGAASGSVKMSGLDAPLRRLWQLDRRVLLAIQASEFPADEENHDDNDGDDDSSQTMTDSPSNTIAKYERNYERLIFSTSIVCSRWFNTSDHSQR